MKSMILALLVSRKFWLTAISAVTYVILYTRHGIDAVQLADVLAASVGVLVLAIAHEDAGAKSSTQAAGGNITNIAPTIPAERPTVPALDKEST